MRAAALAVGLLAAGLVVGCGGRAAKTPDDAGPDLSLFVAESPDFAGFYGWSHHVIDGAAPSGSPHTTGMRTVYINHQPPHGSSRFPVGTIIVKTIDTAPQPPGDMTLNQIFAMAKHGGTFNDGGAVGWEWFELDITSDPPGIIWRGTGPPLGVSYQGVTADCNTCHGAAAGNDYVQDPGLQLTSF